MRGETVIRGHSPVEDVGNLAAERSEYAFDGAPDFLLERAAMDRAEPARFGVTLLEVFRVDRAAFHRTQIRDAAQLHRMQAARSGEVARRQRACAALHELGP